jgi:tetratricopeptide (TPR) repeat protein
MVKAVQITDKKKLSKLDKFLKTLNTTNIYQMKRFGLVIALATWVSVSFAQMAPADFGSKFLEASKLMEEKFWNKARDSWQELVELEKENANVNYKLGYCMLQIPNSKSQALEYLQTAAASDLTKKYDPFDPTERKAPMEVLYYLGYAQHLNYNLDEAIASYRTFLKKSTGKA